MSLDTNLQSAFTAVANSIKNRVPNSALGQANGVATLDATGKVPSSQLPSYVDDVLEYDTITSFPATGESGKIYVTLDTNREYRWSGTIYVQIASGGAVDSVNGKTGNVTLTASDLSLENVDNTADSSKQVLSASKLTTARTINGVPFDGTGNISIDSATTQDSTDNSTKIATTAFVSTAVGNLSTALGSTTTDFVAVFNAGLL